MDRTGCYYEENRPRIRKDDEKMPNKDRYKETTKDFDSSDWCIVFLSDGRKVFTKQLWHSCLAWWKDVKGEIADWDYASKKEIYENRKACLVDEMVELTTRFNEAKEEFVALEGWHKKEI